MTTFIRALALGATLALAANAAFAQATPVGLWKTIDDETKEEKSHIRISDSGGVLSGRIEKLLGNAKQDAVCEKCSDERKDKPVLGMLILRNAKQGVEHKDQWEGGDILDPNNGKVYKLRLKPLDGGKKLEVRGYIGFLYRNQQWIRVE